MNVHAIHRFRFIFWISVVVLPAAISSSYEKQSLRSAFTGQKICEEPDHAMGEIAGEVTQTSVILQSRLTQGNQKIDGDVPGCSGIARFEISKNREFTDSIKTEWIEAVAENDYIVKRKIDNLVPATRYYYRLIYGANKAHAREGNTCTFKTLAEKDASAPLRLAILTCMNYAFFHYGTDGQGKRAYTGPDKILGYPGLQSVLDMEPDYSIWTGDNVYYDHPKEGRARTQTELRKKWHEQFIQPRYIDLFAETPTYWMKDDHDFRFNDCDLTGDEEPSVELGIRTFIEQVPVADPNDKNPATYRTFRLNKHVQIWLMEGRDYRSPNAMPDGPEKTLWGKEQIAWLHNTLLESDATFKFLISPTPLVGPDDAYKKDNHVNHEGFRHEGDAFFTWLTSHDFLNKKLYLFCGDRHWQYHSIHPSGFEEFSCGTIEDANSRMGRKPGDPKSTDPNAEVKQLYTQNTPSGGFLMVTVTPTEDGASAHAEFVFYDENGVLMYRYYA
ncbi:MAG: alkaline phosphatase [Candidatus Omnitrophota bacterium]|jgi:alkaline phosphatase/alkaline phosphatase D|nr:MAG: alkaline phosphatase [Candidatus Omnitrophota bacterium]